MTPIKPKPSVNFKAAAESLMFTGKLLPELQYRKGKTADDVRKALEYAKHPRNGMGCTNAELSCLTMKLKQVFLREPLPATFKNPVAA